MDRRGFVRSAVVAGAGVLSMVGTSWAQRIRVIPPPDPAEPSGMPGNVPGGPLGRLLSRVRPGAVATAGAVVAVWLEGAGEPGAPPALTLEEAQRAGDLTISERGRETVPELVVDNRGKSFVLLLAGEILLGGKQNRVLREDLLLPPLSGPRTAGVYCVEQGRWSGDRRDFEGKQSFAQPGLRGKVMEGADQRRVWQEVARSVAAAAPAPSPTASYHHVYEQPDVQRHLAQVEERLAGSRVAASALGAAAFVNGQLSGVDLFGRADLFARHWPKLLRAYAVDAYRLGKGAEPDQAALRAEVAGLLAAAGAARGTTHASAGAGHRFEFRVPRGGAALRGAALVYESQVVHAAML
jgi:hypothetical protein